MEEKAFFTAKEREQLFALYKRLLQLSGDTLQKGDCHKLKIHLIKAVAEGNLPRNCFGMNPIIKDMQTAVIVAEEIGMKRASILGIMLHESVKNHLCTLASVQQEYGEDVAAVIRSFPDFSFSEPSVSGSLFILFKNHIHGKSATAPIRLRIPLKEKGPR